MRSMIMGAVILVLAAAGCGSRQDTIATVGDRRITEEDFRNAFENLSPSEQVGVLEPGGRLALVERLVNKNLLEIALERRGAPGSEWWVGLYEDAMLCSAWKEDLFRAFMEENPGMESFLDLAGTFSLRIILVPDSAEAARALALWNEPDLSRSVRMSLAPWSMGDVSHRAMEGFLWQLPADLKVELGEFSGQGPVIIPLYGVWAVAELDVSDEAPIDSVPPEAALSAFNLSLRERSSISPSSPSIEALAAHLEFSETGYSISDEAGLDRSAVIATYSGGELTVGEIADIITRTGPWDFFGNPPMEIGAFIMPAPTGSGTATDLWFFTVSVAQTRWAASAARSDGIDLPLGDVALMASVEHLLRLEVLDAVEEPDSEAIMAFYESRADGYTLPERRSALIAYVPVQKADSIGTPSSFDDLGEWTPRDSLGSPIPTPPQSMEVFGPMGESIFAASAGGDQVYGPVEIGVEGIRAYFQVLEVLPEAPAEPALVWGILTDDCRAVRIQDAYAAFISELRSESGVEIDTAAVENVDPWSGSY